MTDIIEIKTKRLLLRQWRESDVELFAKLNANPNVMNFFPSVLTRSQSNELANNIKQRIAENGWGFWAVEIPDECEFIGFVGLNKPHYTLPFDLEVEIGWRLAENYWGQGYATEAAQAALKVGFSQLHFTEIVSFTSRLNIPSINVMNRLQMSNTNNNFEHPKVTEGHKLRDHCLYKITRKNWIKNTGENE